MVNIRMLDYTPFSSESSLSVQPKNYPAPIIGYRIYAIPGHSKSCFFFDRFWCVILSDVIYPCLTWLFLHCLTLHIWKGCGLCETSRPPLTLGFSQCAAWNFGTGEFSLTIQCVIGLAKLVPNDVRLTRLTLVQTPVPLNAIRWPLLLVCHTSNYLQNTPQKQKNTSHPNPETDKLRIIDVYWGHNCGILK